MATTNSHQKSPPHGEKLPQPRSRPLRPAPLTKKPTPQGILKNPSGGCKAGVKGQDEEGMAASFLQFCCRKKDNYQIPTYPLLQPETPLRVSPFVNMGTNDYTPRDIIPQASPRVPTANLPLKLSPLNTRIENRHNRTQSSKTISDAHNYLLQFHRTTSKPTSPASNTVGYTTPYTAYVPTPSISRPPITHSNTASTTSTTTPPSLTHSSSASPSPTSTEYNFSTRPLPPRHDPQSYSACSRSIDLVTPHLSTAYSVPTTLKTMVLGSGTKRIDNGELLYEKRWTLPSMETRRGSLQKLLEGQDSKAKVHSNSGIEAPD